MKNIIKIATLILTLAFFVNCQEDDAEVGAIIVPTNLMITAEILGLDTENPNGDGSGFVNFIATADDALSYNFQFGDGESNAVPSGVNTHRYSIPGLNTYTVVVSAVGTGGVSTTETINIDVFSSFDDLEAKVFLSGGEGNSKIWYPKLDEAGHLGVGPTLAQDNADDGDLNGHWFPQYDSTAAFGKCGSDDSDCFCDFTLSFALSADETLTFNQNNNGQTFFNWASGSAVGQTFGEFEDTCFDFDTSAESTISLAPTETDWSQVADPNFPAPRGTVMNFSNDGFMGYYTGVTSYEILEVDNNYLYVRFFDNANPVLAWYQKFTTTLPTQEFNTVYNDLVWEDEFDADGAPDATKWTYDLGNGVSGWGNQELQSYTNNAENVIIENGFLKITAKADGSGYTSARLKSEDLYEFTYGRVEVRAKLPASQGTWPAIWTLGADYQTNTWPACGELDIMEQKGQDKNTVLATAHHPAVSPGAGDSGSTVLTTSTTEFHNYTMEWTPDTIIFLVDDNVYHTVANSPDLPFDSDFFFILNIAMGGTLGGTIDPGFTQDSMEIDYVRVYQ
ncbi:glycoside hydrolase family 16 protein [Psychroserpens burtonensis]|uniref:Glycoside hydrolase family 16 protein n=1 Tax=Psychroserpens burtonensis TaxID=49278 RepID=A0A5C7BD35_9FLAO|nr:glycoside hydrolase family 16 protein [Psychroserpens burtonensis]TXE19675.1 glycoside hydrolase family 16 protein [Psychroserpens burtonensis]